MAANALDRLIGWINPTAGVRRQMARTMLSRAYEAAAPMDRWRPRRSGASANADHLGDAAILRNKARSCYQNVPYVRAGIDGLVSATVGSGIMPRATGRQAARINKLITRWSKQADADGRLHLPGLIAQAYRTMEVDGEVLIRLRPRLETDGLVIPLQIQVLEIDWIDSTRNNRAPENNNVIISGIEYDQLGRVAAYWLWDAHPGDVSVARTLRTQSRRVEARYIIHVYNPERPGQGRGFTRLAPVINRIRDLALYEDAELARKNLETRLGVLYSGDPDLMANPRDGKEPDVKDGDLGDLPSGGLTRLPAGSSIEVVSPTPAAGYVDALKFNIHLIAAGIGVTYEIMTGDGSDVNFSSARILRLNMKRNVEQTQWMVLMPMLLAPLHRAIVDAAVLGRQLSQPDYEMDCTFPRWDYVNPQQEITADMAEVAAGMSSISEKIRIRGYDPETVMAESEKDFQRLGQNGLLKILMALQGKTMPADQPAPRPAATT